MEISSSYLITAYIVVVVILSWKVLNWIWFKPKKLEKILKNQGFNGNSYRLLYGDMKEIAEMYEEAMSKPINLSNDFVLRVQPFFVKTVNKYGKNFFTWQGPRPSVFIMDPELIQEVLVKFDQFHKPRSNPFMKMLVEGIVTYVDDKWVKHRKIMNPAFHLEKLKQMLPAMSLSCVEMLSKWEEIASPSGSCEMDVWPYLQTLTSDVISRTAFGSSYEEGRKIFELQREQAEHVILAVRSIYIPGLRFLPTKRNRRMKKIANEVQATVEGIIDKRLKAMEKGEYIKDDLLGILLESNFNEIEEHVGKKRSGMSLQEIVNECKLFYFAGQETTSVLLLWTMVLLCKHPEWQTRAREEVLQEFGKEKPVYDRLNHLKIVTMILYEVLRLYPPAPVYLRKTTKEIKLGNVSLPADMNIQIPLLLLHHDSEIWGADAKEFRPERFSEGVLKAAKGKVAYFPFGWGPQICIGQNFAMLEAKLALAMILQGFSFDLSPSYAHAPFFNITIQPQYGAHLILRKL